MNARHASMSASTPHWLETVWQVKTECSDDLQTQLTQLGSLGSYQKLPLMPDDPMPAQSELISYFSDLPLKTIKRLLVPLENTDAKLTGITRIPQADWATAWKQYFKPFKLTDHVVIRPSWEVYAAGPDDIVVTLDPGMAFGTGQHDTTRFCAEIITDLKNGCFTKGPYNGTSFLDIGCGSGILSIIARKLGFDDVVGIDIDAASIATANENLERNPDTKPIYFFLTDGGINQTKIKPADVVVANIIAETLCELKDDLIKLVKPHGYLILSGILPERASLITETFCAFKLIHTKKSKDWHAYIYNRQ